MRRVALLIAAGVLAVLGLSTASPASDAPQAALMTVVASGSASNAGPVSDESATSPGGDTTLATPRPSYVTTVLQGVLGIALVLGATTALGVRRQRQAGVRPDRRPGRARSPSG